MAHKASELLWIAISGMTTLACQGQVSRRKFYVFPSIQESDK